jgi:hypothetical protein
LQRLFDTKQGTLEFWVKALWDPRLHPVPRMSLLGNGVIDAQVPWKLPHREWAHIAIVWRPLKKEPQQNILHIYINGVDRANYRNIYWEGYGDRPPSLPSNGKWLEAFISKAPPGVAFALDEVRVSSIARYVDLDVDFGGQQTINPHRFVAPGEPFRLDRHTTLLFHLDGDLHSETAVGRP